MPGLHLIALPSADVELERKIKVIQHLALETRRSRAAYADHSPVPPRCFDCDEEWLRWRNDEDALRDAYFVARRRYETACDEFFLNIAERSVL